MLKSLISVVTLVGMTACQSTGGAGGDASDANPQTGLANSGISDLKDAKVIGTFNIGVKWLESNKFNCGRKIGNFDTGICYVVKTGFSPFKDRLLVNVYLPGKGSDRIKAAAFAPMNRPVVISFPERKTHGLVFCTEKPCRIQLYKSPRPTVHIPSTYGTFYVLGDATFLVGLRQKEDRCEITLADRQPIATRQGLPEYFGDQTNLVKKRVKIFLADGEVGVLPGVGKIKCRSDPASAKARGASLEFLDQQGG
jgi:hypothetical protein